jgi:hypothetical protein
MGDRLGGSGYELLQPDGSIRKYYFQIPSDITTVSVYFPDPPKTHLGKKLGNKSIEMLTRLYLNYLQKLVREAKLKFGKPSGKDSSH